LEGVVRFVRLPDREDDLDQDVLEQRWSDYEAFLRASDHSSSGDLLRFFGRQFFHDGSIRRLRFGASSRTVRFRIQSEWVARPDGRSVRPAPEFDIVFEGVIGFEWSGWRIENRWFIQAEIDSLADRLATAEAECGGRFHSIVIDSLTDTLSIVFRSVAVTPVDHAYWESLLRNPEMRVPLFEV